MLGLECEASKLRVGGRDLRGHRDSSRSVDTRQEFTKHRGTAVRDRGLDVAEVSRRSAEGQKHGRRPAEGTVTSACACGHVAGAHFRTWLSDAFSPVHSPGLFCTCDQQYLYSIDCSFYTAHNGYALCSTSEAAPDSTDNVRVPHWIAANMLCI